MKKTIIVLAILILLIVGGIWWWNSTQKMENNQQADTNTSNYQAEKSSTKTNTAETTKKEIEMTQFSTKIHNKAPERQNNIGITCKSLSSKEVQPGETFSFCETVGKATTEKGYQKADIFVDGKKEQGLGGGNCQVSTTLYNAVLQVPELEVVERHEHSSYVPYIEKGKDAAVSYGAYDFKFKNNTNNVIKIVMENTEDNITAKLIKIEELPRGRKLMVTFLLTIGTELMVTLPLFL